jgi:hypothetical protein
MEVKAGPSKGKSKILVCSESLKEGYYVRRIYDQTKEIVYYYYYYYLLKLQMGC